MLPVVIFGIVRTALFGQARRLDVRPNVPNYAAPLLLVSGADWLFEQAELLMRARATRQGHRKKARPGILSRSAAFSLVIFNSLLFTFAALLALTFVELLGFDLSSTTQTGVLKRPIAMFIALMFSIGITAAIGSLVGFYLLLRSRFVPTPRVLAMGATFGGIAYVLFVPTLDTVGLSGGAVLFVVLAAALALGLGRMVSRRHGSRR